MTANELAVMLGRAWSRLLIYPGGMAAFGIIWLINMLQNREPPRGYPTENQVRCKWFLVLDSRFWPEPQHDRQINHRDCLGAAQPELDE